MNKPISAKPSFYALVYEGMKTIAKEYGWNLLIDGSMNRDLDLVLVPWIDNRIIPERLIQIFNDYLGGKIMMDSPSEGKFISNVPNGAGRKKAVIQLNRESRFDQTYGSKDDEYYVDITIYH